MKNQKAITLVALIITVIVLLVLAGVTISALTGENSIITRAKSAVKQHEIAEEEETIKLAYSEYMLNKIISPDATFEVEGATVTGSDEEGFVVTYDKNGNSYTISENATITYIDGELFYALWCDADKSLTFISEANVPEKGATYNDKVVTKIYRDVTTREYNEVTEVPWQEVLPEVETAVIQDDVDVKSTAYWLYEASNLTSATIGDNIKKIGHGTFTRCTNLTGHLEIPNSTEVIGDFAFEDCVNLTGLEIGDNVKYIGHGGFAKCTGLTGDLIIPNSVTEMGPYAFQGCTGFNGTLTLSSNLEEIKDATFISCTGLTGGLNIPDSVKIIGTYAFAFCQNFTSVDIPDSITTIGVGAFCECKNISETLTIPSSTTTIGDYAFQNCIGITGIEFQDSVDDLTTLTIGEFAFSNCIGLSETLNISDRVNSIGKAAFYGCNNIEVLNTGNGLVNIGEFSFQACTGLTTATIGEAVKVIGDCAFEGCRNLSSMDVYGTDINVGLYAIPTTTVITYK